jgi:hypothetical protein
MKRLVSRAKAVTKILTGVVVASFLGSLGTLIIVLMTGMGIFGLILGIAIMIGAVMLGSMVGARWAKTNIIDKEDVKKIALWSALIFLVVNVMVSGIGTLLSSVVSGMKTDLLIQILQIIAQSFVIYAISRWVMIRLIKKENNE